MFSFAHIMNGKFRGMTMIGDVIIGSPKDHTITNKYVKRARNYQWTDIPVDIIKNYQFKHVLHQHVLMV